MNLQTDQFKLYKMITDELTNISVHFIQDGENILVRNELANRSVHFR
jgi:hypothetical protein